VAHFISLPKTRHPGTAGIAVDYRLIISIAVRRSNQQEVQMAVDEENYRAVCERVIHSFIKTNVQKWSKR